MELDFTCEECESESIVYSSMNPSGRCRICGADKTQDHLPEWADDIEDGVIDDYTGNPCNESDICFFRNQDGYCDKCR